MADEGNNKHEDVRDGATDSHTLDEIESEENVPSSKPETSVPSPDEGSGRTGQDSVGQAGVE